MKQINLIIISGACFIIGALVLAYTQDWIMFRFPSAQSETLETTKNLRARKKQVNLLFWHDKKWNTERVDILETDDTSLTLQHLINRWLSLLAEDHIMSKKVTLQSVLIASNGQAYLSFDRTPFDEQSSTHEKWMWIEGLLKTVRENNIHVQSIHFLVHHQNMKDYHLDFSKPWPLSGFLPCT